MLWQGIGRREGRAGKRSLTNSGLYYVCQKFLPGEKDISPPLVQAKSNIASFTPDRVSFRGQFAPPPLGTDIVKFCACGESYKAGEVQVIESVQKFALKICRPESVGPELRINPWTFQVPSPEERRLPRSMYHVHNLCYCTPDIIIIMSASCHQ